MNVLGSSLCLHLRVCDISSLSSVLAMAPSLYEILCVEPTASQPELKAAYKRRVLEVHPDKVRAKNGEVEGHGESGACTKSFKHRTPSRILPRAFSGRISEDLRVCVSLWTLTLPQQRSWKAARLDPRPRYMREAGAMFQIGVLQGNRAHVGSKMSHYQYFGAIKYK